jgi:phosphohistidine phosphatase
VAGTRTLILVRHAKSSWANAGLADHDRPLNARGERDAPIMAARLAERGPRPDTILSSSAKRALATADRFAEAFDMDERAVILRPEIYGAGVDDMLELVQALDDARPTVLLVGHNPTFTELVDRLTDVGVGHLPTTGVVTLELAEGPWAAAHEGLFRLVDFDYPKKG